MKFDSPDKKVMAIVMAIVGIGLLFHFKKRETTIPSLSGSGTKVWTKPVTNEMTEWAKSIVATPSLYPMGQVSVREFDGVPVTARVEEHEWTYRNGVKVYGKFRGVTLYERLT